ncbi:hypothetical protein [Sinorhizobium americanum]|uniref:Uncharacterized protein n=1 Tax=Sinorhizobium americanum TaxID=194963 RepID=A0A1L3LWP8_9HYPH|nr:hypothetical protein [Sinorhizobium americanum]APG88741.1 hypothetical protein SAMCCGM7_pC1555 [Sinorhizobium americanum CCGM7]APG94453.1 hypothetical protein SAMCFNEI73_pC0734 [Sinorhizobium americanum]TCN31512.1 hypothetical protein EV184_106285 [Sinorhizobium americanum]
MQAVLFVSVSALPLGAGLLLIWLGPLWAAERNCGDGRYWTVPKPEETHASH